MKKMSVKSLSTIMLVMLNWFDIPKEKYVEVSSLVIGVIKMYKNNLDNERKKPHRLSGGA